MPRPAVAALQFGGHRLQRLHPWRRQRPIRRLAPKIFLMTDQSDAGSVGIFSWRTNQMYYLAGGPPPRPSAEGLRTPRAPHKLFRRESAGKMRGNAGKCGKIRENSENFETPT
eukprot:2877391-Pyramimonas_sp.AAC.1